MNDVSSYLEMGANSGRLVSWLHDNFSFQKCGAVSLAPMKYVHDHNKKVASEFGHIDMVLIDGDHSYEGCLKDYHLELEMPHRFIAFHDVANKKYTGVAEVW
eukprot:CAMPEP_0182882404 /NCGR_PEP_ID=MMETSP0034_2-20130328/17761_1 /TAXON_ID=156128 /ORGANISM="Nephroselmis pyriformis, Strain CCMP717" /LENGTH=101 /DNA_ID=CAMNT_0025015501 /DNA_START=542 /DNA_END=845 /DNA_ORIENTATION=-